MTSNSLSHTGLATRLSSWYEKAKDSAVGTNFDHHVMGGYRFLMQYYSPGDDLYFFGFSRGAYTARFLAEMLEYVGLLAPGSEELARFAWKTFARWQQRRSGDPEDEKKKTQIFEFMKAFRETFSRPVRRIRFLGLFDTVNSVPRFEAAWMQRSRYPYTARSSAKVIRHAVAIDERRAKFRQDLVSGHTHLTPHHRHHLHHHSHGRSHVSPEARYKGVSQVVDFARNGGRDARRPSEMYERPRQGSRVTASPRRDARRPSEIYERPRRSSRATPSPRREARRPSEMYEWPGPDSCAADAPLINRDVFSSGASRGRSKSPLSVSTRAVSPDDQASNSEQSFIAANLAAYDSDDEDDSPTGSGRQSIEEVWFPGSHADVGGGWRLAAGERHPLSHVPLVWMVREAQHAGLRFDEDKMRALSCYDDRTDAQSTSGAHGGSIPDIFVTASTPLRDLAPPTPAAPSSFQTALEQAMTRGQLHDCLSFNRGLPLLSVLSWTIMEFLPFRRMDLQPDGSWKPIRWPLPRGEVRDIPADARIHTSALKRMEYDESYRPGNLILGGGGRGVRIAPAKAGVGKWKVVREEGDLVGEVFVRDMTGA